MKDCPISKNDFLESAEEILMVINDKPVEMRPKQFSTGSFGWNASTRMHVTVGGIPLTVQMSSNVTVLKSKDAPEITPETNRIVLDSSHQIIDTHSGSDDLPIYATNYSLAQLLPVKEVLFFPDTPENKNLNRIFEFINAAEHTIDVCVFVFTDNRLYSTLMEAKNRGVKIRLIVDDQMSLISSSKAFKIFEQGVKVRMDASNFHMHHKFAIIDRKVIMFGSFNWTVQAQRSNRENLHITCDMDVINSYREEFDKLWAEYENNHPSPPKEKK